MNDIKVLPKLSAKRKRFAEEYLVDYNATKAAERAGYSKKTAYSQGTRLLENVDISEYLTYRKNEILQELRADALRTVREIVNCALVDPKDMFRTGIDNSGKERKAFLLPPDMPRDVRAAIASFKIKAVQEYDKSKREHYYSHHVIDVKLWDKSKFIDMLGKFQNLLTDTLIIEDNTDLGKRMRLAQERVAKYKAEEGKP